MAGCKVHPGNVLFLLPAQAKFPPGIVPFILALPLKVQREKSHTKARPAARGCLSSHAMARLLCAGKRPARLPAPRCSSCSPSGRSKPQPACGSPGWHWGSSIISTAQGRELGWLGAMPFASRGASEEQHHSPESHADTCQHEMLALQGAKARSRHHCLGNGGTWSCQSPGLGPGRIVLLEGLLLPAAHGGGKPNMARSLLLSAPVDLSPVPTLLLTRILLPHHSPGFASARSLQSPGSPQGEQ